MDASTCNTEPTCAGEATCPRAATCDNVATCNGSPTCAMAFTCGGWPTCQKPPVLVPQKIFGLFDSDVAPGSSPKSGDEANLPHFSTWDGHVWHGRVHSSLILSDPGFGFITASTDMFMEISYGNGAKSVAAVVETVIVNNIYESSSVADYIDSDSDGLISSGDYVLMTFTDPPEIAGETWYLVERAGVSPAPTPNKSAASAIVADLISAIPGSCVCDCHADPACDGVTNVLDVVQAVNVAFRGQSDILDPNAACPNVTTDVNCDGVTNVLDVVRVVNVAFRGGDANAEFCDPCAP
jgi:hypothetical protein